MTGLASSTGPTLLGKLRALESRYNTTVDDYDGNQSAVNYAHQCAAHDLADLLPQIIAQIESDAKDAARYRWLRSGQRLRQGVDIGVGHRRIAKDLTHELMAFSYWCTPEQLDTAIDAAKDRT